MYFITHVKKVDHLVKCESSKVSMSPLCPHSICSWGSAEKEPCSGNSCDSVGGVDPRCPYPQALSTGPSIQASELCDQYPRCISLHKTQSFKGSSDPPPGSLTQIHLRNGTGIGDSQLWEGRQGCRDLSQALSDYSLKRNFHFAILSTNPSQQLDGKSLRREVCGVHNSLSKPVLT